MTDGDGGRGAPASPVIPHAAMDDGRLALRGRVSGWLTCPIAPEPWDRLLWASAAVALGGILAMAFAPAVTDLAVFFSLSLLINGPYGGFLPTAYEPIVMVFARLHDPALIGFLGATAATLVEVVNYRVFHVALHSHMAGRLRASPLARRVLRWFGVQPFATIAVCAIVPIPFWLARAAATLASYPIRRHLAASGIGRFVRLTFYGYLGTVLRLSNGTILLLGAVIAVLLGALMVHRARRFPRSLPPGAIETA